MGSRRRIKGWVETDKRIFAYQGDEKRSTAQEMVIHKPTDQSDALGTAHVPKIILSASGHARSTGGAERYTGIGSAKPQQATLGKFDPTRSPTSTFSARDFLARASALLENDRVSETRVGRCFTRYAESLGLRDLACSSLRMLRDFFRLTEGKLSLPFFKNYGISDTGWSGRLLTARITESPRTAPAYSLSDILEESVPERYFLSAKMTAQVLKQLKDQKAKLLTLSQNKAQGDKMRGEIM